MMIYKQVKMKTRLLTILFFIFIFKLYSQSICKNYKQTQNWIKSVNKLEIKNKKDSIIKLIECNQLDTNKSKLNVITYINRKQEIIETNRTVFFNKIESKNFHLLNSMCEGNFYPQRCELGTVLIDIKSNIICNQIEQLNITKIKVFRKKTKIYLESASESMIDLIIEKFYNGQNKKYKKLELKKGKNIIELENKEENQLLTFKNGVNELTLII